LNDGTKWNEYAFSSRFDGSPVERSRHDIIPKDVLSGLTFVPAHWTPTGGGELKHPSFRPAFRTYLSQYPKFSDLTFAIRSRNR
jgi:hypothetical protein